MYGEDAFMLIQIENVHKAERGEERKDTEVKQKKNLKGGSGK